MLTAQLRFAESLGKLEPTLTTPKKKKPKRKRNTNQDETVELSTEMESWLHNTFQETDSEGFLKEALGSVLTQPLDSMAIFCPTASIISSKTAAPKIPNKYGTQKLGDSKLNLTDHSTLNGFEGSDNNNLTFKPEFPTDSYSQSHSNVNEVPKFSASVNCLEVMWLKRKAQLEVEDGEYDTAYKTLDKALEIHLGTDDYTKAKLADPVVASDPLELISLIEENYVPYDVTPHAAAERIQRMYRKYYTKLWKAATVLSRYYKGYYHRSKYLKRKFIRDQCAYLIQRRFRNHLDRMNRRASQIKQWYKVRCQMSDYRHRLFIYRMAKRIQRRYRGILGRRLGFEVKNKLVCTLRLQRNARGFIVRARRYLAVEMIHRRLYWAARKIQNRFRIMNAIRNSQGQLIGESVAEEERLEQEMAIYDESIRIEIDKIRLYFKTDAGKLHLKDSSDTIKAKDFEFNKIKATLSTEEILTRDATIAFELFDSDGSGQIDVDELSEMLQELCIPMERHEVEMLAAEMDEDGSGDIDFTEFLDWYTGKGSKDTGNGMGGRLFKQILRARHLVMELTGVTLLKRAQRDVLRQCTAWISRDTTAMFRLKNPPKFSCCQCGAPFVLFSDYFNHFEDEICPETSLKGFFYKNFSNQIEWTNQRMIEYELVRERDEMPCLEYASTIAVFEELALQQDPNFKVIIENYSRAAKLIFLDQLKDPSNNKSLADFILEIIDISNDKRLYPFIAKAVAKILNQSLPTEWYANDVWEVDEFSKWISSVLKPEDADENKKGYINLIKKTCWVNKYEADAKLLGNIYFICLRMMSINTEAELGALMEFRKKRPRRMNISDDELDELSLPNLTKRSYDQVRQKLISKLKILHKKMQELVILSLRPKPPCCKYFTGSKSSEYVAINPGDLSESAFKELRVLDAHNSAAARLRSFLKSRAGRGQISRMASELWAKKQLILRDLEEDPSQRINITLDCDLRYKFELLSSKIISEGIDLFDIDLFQNVFCLKFSKNDIPKISAELEAVYSGFVDLDPMVNWFVKSKHVKFNNNYRQLIAFIRFLVNLIIHQTYQDDAKLKYLTIFRKISRLDLEINHRIISNYLEAAEMDNITNDKEDQSEKELSPENLNSENVDNAVTDNNPNEEPATPDLENVGAVTDNLNIEQEASNHEDNNKTNEFTIEGLESRLHILKADYKKGEERLLFRLTEDDAEFEARKRFFSRTGRYQIKNEKLLLKASKNILSAYGYCIPTQYMFPKKKKVKKITEINIINNDKEESESSVLMSDNADEALYSQQPLLSEPALNIDVNQESIIPAEESANQKTQNNRMSIWIGQFSSLLSQNQDDVKDNPDDSELIDISWKTALSILIHTFDTDCSGSFDESEVKLLLKYLYCGMSDRRLLYEFPEVNHDSASLATLVDHLVTKVAWFKGLPNYFTKFRKINIFTMNNHLAATMLLISLNRQAARELAYQAMINQTGESVGEDDEKKDDAVIIRAQMFAMRQVEMLFQTTHGQLFIAMHTDKLKKAFKVEVKEKKFSKVGLLKYAYHVHKDSNGMLITELPHLIHFIISKLNFIPNENISNLNEIIASVKSKADIKWLTVEETIYFVEPCFDDPFLNSKNIYRFVSRNLKKMYISFNIKLHAMCMINSIARQQAILISLRYQEVNLADTNYRCYVLGLDILKKKSLKSKAWRMVTKGIIGYDSSINWFEVPREATMLLLLSRGFTFADMFTDRIQNVVGAYHPNGKLCDDLVDVESVIFNSRRQEAMDMNILESFYRWCRLLIGLPRYLEYKRTVAVMTQYHKELAEVGAMFLKEIVNGTSHCGETEFLKSHVI